MLSSPTTITNAWFPDGGPAAKVHIWLGSTLDVWHRYRKLHSEGTNRQFIRLKRAPHQSTCQVVGQTLNTQVSLNTQGQQINALNTQMFQFADESNFSNASLTSNVPNASLTSIVWLSAERHTPPKFSGFTHAYQGASNTERSRSRTTKTKLAVRSYTSLTLERPLDTFSVLHIQQNSITITHLSTINNNENDTNRTHVCIVNDEWRV